VISFTIIFLYAVIDLYLKSINMKINPTSLISNLGVFKTGLQPFTLVMCIRNLFQYENDTDIWAKVEGFILISERQAMLHFLYILCDSAAFHPLSTDR